MQIRERADGREKRRREQSRREQRAYDNSTRKRFESEARVTDKKKRERKEKEKEKFMRMRSYIRCRRDEPEHGSGRRGEGRKREVRNCETCSCTLTEEVVEDGINTKNDSTRLARPGVCGGARAAFSRAAQPPARRAGQQKLTTWSGREKRRRGETRSTACSAAWQEAADRK